MQHNPGMGVALEAYLVGFAGAALPEGCVMAEIARARLNGCSKGTNKGLISASLKTPFGELTLTTGWFAFAQALPEHGWYAELRADAKGELAQANFPVLDLDGAPLSPTSYEMRALAWDFWSYQYIEQFVLPLLPDRV